MNNNNMNNPRMINSQQQLQHSMNNPSLPNLQPFQIHPNQDIPNQHMNPSQQMSNQNLQQVPPEQQQRPSQFPQQQQQQQPTYIQQQPQYSQQQQPPPLPPQPPTILQGQLQSRPNVPQSQPNPNPPPSPQPAQQYPSMLCKSSSDLLQDFLTRTMELFQVLRQCSPHFMSNKNTQEDRRNRLRELVKSLKFELNRLRSLYNRIRSLAVPDEELPTALESIIQFEVEKPNPWDSPTKFEEYNSIDKINIHESRWFAMKAGPEISEEQKADNPKMAALEQQYQELLELNSIRNRQLKEVIHQMRQLVWSTNDMLSLRKP